MRQRINPRFAKGLLAIGLCGLAPVAAQAQAAAEKWQFEVGIYGWFPAIGGTTAFPTGAAGPSFDVSAADVLDSLKMTFMGQAEARKGKWGVWTDIVYADLGGSKSGTHAFTIDGAPVSVTADLSLDVKSTVWTLAGLYNLTTTPENTTDLLFGARLLDMQQTLSYTLSASPPQHPALATSGSIQVEGSNWDAVVGLKGRYFFGAERRWFLPYYVDVGAGQSKLTWQVNAGVGYRFDWGALFATWRYLDYDFESGKPLQSMTMNGVLIGAAFQF